MRDLKAFWDKVSANYDKQSGGKYADAYQQTITLSKDHLKSSDIALDFACGTGITTIPLSRYVKEMDAIDISPAMLALAAKKATENGTENIRFLTGQIFDTSLKQNHYDVVMAFNVLYFFEDIPAVLNRIKSLLKSDGIFLSATDCLGKQNRLINFMSKLLYRVGILPYMNKISEKDLKAMFENAGFEILFEKSLYDAPVNYYAAAKNSGK